MARADITSTMDLDSSKFKAGLGQAKKSTTSFVKGAIRQAAAMGAAFLGANAAKSIFNLGLAAEETASKFRAVFGPATEEMNRTVQELRKTIPSTTAAMQDALATFAQMAKSFGLNAQAANEFSTSMVKISGDLASFHNLSSDEAFTKISAAISGEFEPLKRLGIVLNANMVKQEALNLSIYDGVGALDQSAKAIATQSLVLKQMGVAAGDAAATQDSAANRTKRMRAELVELATRLGTFILPQVEAFIEGLEMISKATSWVINGIKEILGLTNTDDTGDDYQQMARQILIAQDKIRDRQKLNAKEQALVNQLAEEYRQKLKLTSKETQEILKNDLLPAEEKKAILTRKRAEEDYQKSLKETIALLNKKPTTPTGADPSGEKDSPLAISIKKTAAAQQALNDATAAALEVTKTHAEAQAEADAAHTAALDTHIEKTSELIQLNRTAITDLHAQLGDLSVEIAAAEASGQTGLQRALESQARDLRKSLRQAEQIQRTLAIQAEGERQRALFGRGSRKNASAPPSADRTPPADDSQNLSAALAEQLALILDERLDFELLAESLRANIEALENTTALAETLTADPGQFSEALRAQITALEHAKTNETALSGIHDILRRLDAALT